MDWIYPANFEAKHEAVRAKRVKESGKWFLSHPLFKAWCSGTGTNMLHCPGLGILFQPNSADISWLGQNNYLVRGSLRFRLMESAGPW